MNYKKNLIIFSLLVIVFFSLQKEVLAQQASSDLPPPVPQKKY
jgi:hypothetical protein